MSAIGGKVDIKRGDAQCPLMTQSGHKHLRAVHRRTRSGSFFKNILHLRLYAPPGYLVPFERWFTDQDGSMSMKLLVPHFVRDVTGATSIEYALIAGGISIAIVVAVRDVGTVVSSLFVAVSTAFQ
jgi:pilus assembly protein Flp/PilA